MTWLFPLGFLWLLSVPVLVWLWRFAAQRRLTAVPSLAPFEHLLARTPRRRFHVVVGVLFWLQLAALSLLSLALARPAVVPRRARTVLVIADTSASLGARDGGRRLFERVQERLRDRARHRRAADQWFLVATAPVTVLTPEPTHDPAVITRAIDGLQVSDLSGDLATAVHIGRGLLADPPDETLVFTDEAPPDDLRGERVTVIGVGHALPNVALIGFDAEGTLCGGSETRLTVSLQNFSLKPAVVKLRAEQQGRRLAQEQMTLAPQAVGRAALALPQETEGWVDVVSESPHDALGVDDRVRLMLRHPSAIPIVVDAQDREFRRLMGRWLGACEGLQVITDPTERPGGPYTVVTDHGAEGGLSRGAVDSPVVGWVQFVGIRLGPVEPILAHWLIQVDHPVGAYLQPVDRVPSPLHPEAAHAGVGEPVAWALVQGRRLPIVLAGELDGRRVVTIAATPTVADQHTPLLVLFFNSLQWVMGRMDVVRTGEPLVVSSLAPGPVMIERPDLRTEQVQHHGGVLRYEATTRAGLYRIRQGRQEQVQAANFLDPAESNLLARPSTWRPPTTEPRGGRAAGPRARRPLARGLIGLALMLLLVEWWLYQSKRRMSAYRTPSPGTDIVR